MGHPDDTAAAGDALAPGLIHELRHPLQGIKASLHFLEESLSAETTGSEDWLLLKGQVHRLEELLRQYQSFLNPAQARPQPFDAAPVVDTAVKLLRYRLRTLGAGFTLEVPEGPVPTLGTPGVLTHAVTNLVLNALDALDEVGGTRLAVRLAAEPGSPERVGVRVSDAGKGLAPESAERLFEQGFTTKGPGKGSGLGLKLSRRLLLAQGGTLAVVAPGEPGRLDWAKTEFLLTLPAAR